VNVAAFQFDEKFLGNSLFCLCVSGQLDRRMSDVVFKSGKARIVEERREPREKARSGDHRRAISSRLSEHRERAVAISQCRIDGGNSYLVDVNFCREIGHGRSPTERSAQSLLPYCFNSAKKLSTFTVLRVQSFGSVRCCYHRLRR